MSTVVTQICSTYTCSMHICIGLVVCMKRGLQERCERITMEREYIVCCFTAKDLHDSAGVEQ